VPSRPITRLLIANRGEIAVRVIRALHELDIEAVAVYSTADEDALHVRLADRAVRIGPPPAAQSYLSMPAIIAAATTTGCDAIHPGYGFLSENAPFAADCAQAGLVFVGPPPAAIRAMASKSAAKTLMQQAGVPLVPGYHGEDQSPALLQREADRIGYPVLIKASAGGGGKGMRRVDGKADFAAALASCQREASASFADARVLVEKYLLQPRHIEIQVFTDTHGHGVYLFERDCSVQRRHQKVLEEAPAPGMTQERRREMGAAAVAAAKAIGYVGAGTVEFVMDAEGRFYFLEVNTRLQVEHPVTEAVTGLDLVRWQILIAQGEPLPIAQEDLVLTGHAIEARLYAEDPANDFLPATGRIALWETADLPGVRYDAGIVAGTEVGIHYDPLLAKIIAHGPTRELAITRLTEALRRWRIIPVIVIEDPKNAPNVAAALMAGGLPIAEITRSVGFVAFRGGMGTVTEISLVWNKLTTGVIGKRPLVLVGDCWEAVVDAWKANLVVSDSDTSFLDFASNADAASKLIIEKSRGVVL